MPPAVVFMDGKLRHPFRICSDEDGKLCVVMSEIPLRSDGVYPIASTLVDWIERTGAKELVVPEGVAVPGFPETRKSYCAAEPEKIKECKEKGVEDTLEYIYRLVTHIAWLSKEVTDQDDLHFDKEKK